MKYDFKKEKICDFEEIYEGISKGRLHKNSKGWNLWLGISFLSIIYIWIIIYSSKFLLIINKLENNDNLIKDIKFEEKLSFFGYNIGELSVSILTFCIQEKEPTLVNIPVRLSLSNQIVKQRYLVRNSIDELNEIELSINKKYLKSEIEKIIEMTVDLLKVLVPLNIKLEEQPSPISPAPPPYYEPQRKNITEEEILNSKESDSSTFLAAKYLCNNTDYISEKSNYLKLKAFNISNPAKLFDLEYINNFGIKNDILNYDLMNKIMIFHYIIILTIFTVTLIIFYFGSMDYFQKNKRKKIMNILRKKIDEQIDYIIKIDDINFQIINEKFAPISKIYKYIDIICNHINEDNNNLNNYIIEKISNINEIIKEFQKCIEISLYYSNIFNNEINKKYKESYIFLSDIIESEIFNFNDFKINEWKNHHHFSENINNSLSLFGNNEEFKNMLNYFFRTLDEKYEKHIFWDIVEINNNELIPKSMMNSLGEINTSIRNILEKNWNYNPIINNNENKKFLTIDIINMNINIINKNQNDLVFKLKNLTRNFNYFITKRMVDHIFGGIIVIHRNNKKFHLEEENIDFDYNKNMIGNTLIIPIKDQLFNIKSKSNNTITLFSCGLDQNYSNMMKSLSKIMDFQYITIDYWDIINEEDIYTFLINKPGFWILDTSILNIIEKESEIINMKKQDYYIENNIDMILIRNIHKIEVLYEYVYETNLNKLYYSLKSCFNNQQYENINKKKQFLNKSEYNYNDIIKLFNRPISEISPELFKNIKNLNIKNDYNSVYSDLISLINVEELLKQNNHSNEIKINKFDISNVNKPEILNKKWYNIDIFELNDNEVIEIAEYLLFYRYDILIKEKKNYKEEILNWPIDNYKIKNFVFEIYKCYHKNNPFHNFYHVVSISITLNQWLDKVSVKKYINSLEAYFLIISSLGHDLDHPGFTNDFITDLQEKSNHIISEFNQYEQQIEYIQNNVISTLNIYNGISILENHHISLLFALLNKEKCNIIPPINSIYFNYSKEIIINSILYTDMSYHKYLSDSIHYFNTQYKIDYQKDEIFFMKKKLYMSILLHSADISNPLLNIEIYFKWAKLIFQEFNNQAKVREILNVNHEKINTVDDFVKSQIGFINVICLPYFELLNQFDPEIISDSIYNLYYNNDYFKHLQNK